MHLLSVSRGCPTEKMFANERHHWGEQLTNADNHSNQMNPNNDAYWSARGYGCSCDDDD